MNRHPNIITVCGSGAVSSTMVSMKIKDMLEEEGIEANITEVMATGLDSLVVSGEWDMIVHTCQIEDKYNIPLINGVGLLTGMETEEIKEKILEIIEN